LNEIGVMPDETGKPRPVNGIILVGYPNTEEEINSLKEHNINLDKIFFLVDTNEDNPEAGKYLSSTRKNFQDMYFIENEIAFAENSLKLLKETYGEEVCKEICIIGSIEEVFNRILV